MAANRRNYYRILHVQPEAPTQVITASYRTMMSKLRLHPDLGGDTAGAALINEAYAVLSDPDKRAKYDLQRQRARTAGRNRISRGLDRSGAQTRCAGRVSVLSGKRAGTDPGQDPLPAVRQSAGAATGAPAGKE